MGSVSGFSDSVVGGAELVSVLLFQSLSSASTVELLAEALILLHEAIQLLGQVVVLTSQNLHVVSEGSLLAALLLLALLRVVVQSTQALDILLGAAKLALSALERFFSLAQLAASFSIALLEALELLAGFGVLSGQVVDADLGALQVVACFRV